MCLKVVRVREVLPLADAQTFDLFDPRPAAPSTLVMGCDAHLLDVAGAVDQVDQEVAEGLFGLVDGHPGPAIACVAVENFDRGWLVVGDLVQSVVPVSLPRDPLDLSKARKITAEDRANDRFQSCRVSPADAARVSDIQVTVPCCDP
jgi:hypothetical protein